MTFDFCREIEISHRFSCPCASLCIHLPYALNKQRLHNPKHNNVASSAAEKQQKISKFCPPRLHLQTPEGMKRNEATAEIYAVCFSPSERNFLLYRIIKFRSTRTNLLTINSKTLIVKISVDHKQNLRF